MDLNIEKQNVIVNADDDNINVKNENTTMEIVVANDSKDIEVETPEEINIEIGVVNVSDGTNDHNKLINRDKENQHPIGAITGLEEALNNAGSIKDVQVNGKSVVGDDKIANVKVFTKTSELINDSGYISGIPEKYVTDDELNNAIKDKANKTDIPTKVSQLQNDEGFVTSMANNLTNYYLKSETYTKVEVDKLIGNTDLLTSVTYEKLKSLRDNAELVAGMFYRITNYVTTTIQENTQSAGHQFDIIVRALDESTLDEETQAIQSDGDEYFANSNLTGWQVWYTLDNDASKYAWADEVNGKGVIYRLIDENGNDAPYDFKNIQMQNANDTTDETYYYTFNCTDGIDHSLNGDKCFNNTIEKYIDGVQRINRIIFTNNASGECSGNTFNLECYNNTIGNNCTSNTFGRECHSNILGGYSHLNNFGHKFRSNKVGSEVQSNIFENGASNNIIANNTYYCTFGAYFRNNILGAYLYHSSFGRYVQNFILGKNEENIITKVRYLTIENNVTYVNLYRKDGVSGQLQNIIIGSGVNGSSANRIMIPIEVTEQGYGIKIAKNSDGELITYCEEDKEEVPTKVSQLENDSNFVSDANYIHTDNNFTDEDKRKLDTLENFSGNASDIPYEDNFGYGGETVQEALDAAFNALDNSINQDYFSETIGDIGNLETEDTSNIVNAINNVNLKLKSLPTIVPFIPQTKISQLVMDGVKYLKIEWNSNPSFLRYQNLNQASLYLYKYTKSGHKNWIRDQREITHSGVKKWVHPANGFTLNTNHQCWGIKSFDANHVFAENYSVDDIVSEAEYPIANGGYVRTEYPLTVGQTSVLIPLNDIVSPILKVAHIGTDALVLPSEGDGLELKLMGVKQNKNRGRCNQPIKFCLVVGSGNNLYVGSCLNVATIQLFKYRVTQDNDMHGYDTRYSVLPDVGYSVYIK